MNIGIYPRKSVFRDSSESITTQIKLCKEYANIIFKDMELNFIIYDKDEGFSGKNTNRPSYNEMMEDVKDGLLDNIMVYKLDRIARNVQDFSNTFSYLKDHKVGFISVKESFDTTTPIGRTVMYILAAFAELERDNTVERVTDNMLELAKKGYWTGGRTPSGMKNIKKEVEGKTHSFLVVDEETVDFVKNIYKLFLSGYTITGLETYFRQRNITTLSGAFLSTSQLHNILTNPVYCQNTEEVYDYFFAKDCKLPDKKLFDGQNGFICYGRKKSNSTQNSKNNMADWTITIGIHDWVITGEDWIAVQNKLGTNKQFRKRKYEYGILNGVLKCSCGALMRPIIYKKGIILFKYYKCTKRERQGKEYCDMPNLIIDDIDALILDHLKKISIDKNLIQLQKKASPAPIDIAEIKKQISLTENKIKNLTEALAENITSAASKYIISQIEKLDLTLISFKNELQKSKFAERYEKKKQENIDFIYEQVCALIASYDNFSYTEINNLIRATMKECRINNDTLEIIF